MDAAEPRLHPIWRQAEADLLRAGLTYGSVVTDEWIDEAFGIAEPKSITEYKRNELLRLQQFESLRDSLLENHRMMLTRTKNVGYTVVAPEQQTRLAMKQRSADVRRALLKMKREVSFVNAGLLDDAGRKENADALAKLGSLRSMVHRQLKDQ